MSDASVYTWDHGAIVRGPRGEPAISLIFTGGDFGEGTEEVLDALREHGVPGSFFFTGDYLRNEAHHPSIARLLREGHYLGPHSDGHPLYCPWEDRRKTLVTREEFRADLERNLADLEAFGVNRAGIRWWIPPYEWYNEDIVRWSLEMGLQPFNFTPGTLSNADYTTEDARNYRSSETIHRSILDHETQQEDGLNGFLLLTHVGAGPGRRDKFFHRLGTLIGELTGRGYAFERVDELLRDAPHYLEPEGTA